MSTEVKTTAKAKVVEEEVAEVVEVISIEQASLADCLAQLNKTRQAEQALKIAEEKAIAEARAKVYTQ